MTVVRLAALAMMTALVFVSNYLRITIPINIGGNTSFTLANILCCLSGLLLGPIGGLASGLGSMLFDFTDPRFISEFWLTFLTKGAYGLAVGLIAWSAGRRGEKYGWNLAGTVTGAVVYAALYLFKGFAWDGLLLGGLQAGPALAALVPKLPATTFNAVVAIVCAPALAAAVQKARHSVTAAQQG